MNGSIFLRGLRSDVASTIIAALVLLSSSFSISGCTTLKELAALRDVDFSLDSVTDVHLADVELRRGMAYSDLSVIDIARLGRELAANKMPLSFNLNIGALNPAENTVQARLVRLDWTLLLEDRETVSGVFSDEVVLPPGQVQRIPFGVELDLIQFFGSNLRDLADLALAISNQGGAPKNVKLRAIPTVDTPLGPIRYPEAITIVNRTVGS